MTVFSGTYIFIFAGLVAATKASSWHYGEESEWKGYCQTGTEQSPINIEPRYTIVRDYVAFNLTNYNNEYRAAVTNSGHSVVIRFLKATEELPKLSGGGLPDTYVLDQVHFHWQSEHTIDGLRYPLEMHIVHYAEKYGSLEGATPYKYGVTVLGILFELSPDDDEYFEPFIEVMKVVERTPEESVITNHTLTPSIFMPRDHSGYYRYEGSLTTPTCDEGVIWTIFTHNLPMSIYQVKEFENVYTDEGLPLSVSYRSIQPLNDRTVFWRPSPLLQSQACSIRISWTTMLCLLVVSYYTKK